MLHQAHYFETHPDSRFSQTADDTVYPFNEFLHILVELGIPGLSAIGVFFALSIFIPIEKRDKTDFKSRINRLFMLFVVFLSEFGLPSICPFRNIFGMHREPEGI